MSLAAVSALVAASAFVHVVEASGPVYISNTLPRRDVDGNIMDIHDGVIRQWGGLYHYYGMG
jgi:hypothetical protein